MATPTEKKPPPGKPGIEPSPRPSTGESGSDPSWPATNGGGSWLDNIVAWSLHHRLVVLVLSAGLIIWGGYVMWRMPVDVLPDLTAPTVTVLTEAYGLSPVEVEQLVTRPLETALGGATGVRRIRSSSLSGFSVVRAEFDWEVDIFRARQMVGERLQQIATALPEQAERPVMAPISSIMGEVMFIAVHSSAHSLMKVRTKTENTVRRRLLTVPGVAQVLTIGGEVKQYQILLRPKRLWDYQLRPAQVVAAIKKANMNRWGGLLVKGGRQYSIEALGRLRKTADLKRLTVAVRKGIPVHLEQIALVRALPALPVGQGSYNGIAAVVLGIQKQPEANTLSLTRALDRVLINLQKRLPKGFVIERKGFRQADFIKVALKNVQSALIEGAILVVIILFIFLFNIRATVISAMAIPLSVITAYLLMEAMGFTINTMTLGGITVAIGALVDDGVIFVENIFRRLRLNNALDEGNRRPPLAVIFSAASEIKDSIFFATLIVMVVFLPIFFLGNVEGRLLKPLGLAYLISIGASLAVALTVTPVLSYFFFARGWGLPVRRESLTARFLKRLYRPLLRWCLGHPWLVSLPMVAVAALALVALFSMGRSFLPPFNEGSLTLAATTLPGTSLKKSNALALLVEKALLKHPEVVSTTRRTGRGELDEHTVGAFATEIEVVLEMKKRSMAAFLKALRDSLARVPGMQINIGGPISHRIDHILSGTRSAIAVKIFGLRLDRLVAIGRQVDALVKEVPGAVDVALEPLIRVPQYHIKPRYGALGRHGLTPGGLMKEVERALRGEVATHIVERQLPVAVLVRYRQPYPRPRRRTHLENLPILTPAGASIPLKALAHVRYATGPNSINREGGERRIVVSANVAGGDLIGVVKAIQKRVDGLKLPLGYRVAYGGQFKSEAAASHTLILLSLAVLVGIFLILYVAFGNMRSVLLILLNVPLALFGGVFALYLGKGIVSVASLVGFITLFGIAARNGIMMLGHYRHLIDKEGRPLREAVIQGSLERLNPILMTALTTALAVIPLVLASGEPGNEIQSPMAVVILGGLVTSTLLNLLLLPVLFYRFGTEGR